MRAYLAGKMTGEPDLGFPMFNRVAAQLRAKGHDIVNPAEINGGAAELVACAAMTPEQLLAHWRACMRRDIAELVTCEGIFMLPNWMDSRGALIEHGIARDLGLRIVYLQVEEVMA